jgi:hypothetical protein
VGFSLELLAVGPWTDEIMHRPWRGFPGLMDCAGTAKARVLQYSPSGHVCVPSMLFSQRWPPRGFKGHAAARLAKMRKKNVTRVDLREAIVTVEDEECQCLDGKKFFGASSGGLGFGGTEEEMSSQGW